MPGRMEFKFDFGSRLDKRAPAFREGWPMRLLVMGDFTGKPAAERPPLASRPTHRVDLDNFDHVIRLLEPRVSLQTGELRIDGLEAFHPDSLYARFDLFDALRRARAKVPPEGGDLLGSLLGKIGPATPQRAADSSTPAGGIDAFIRAIVAPHTVADTAAQTQSYQAAVDSAIAEQMRRLLHDPAFQRLESAWRGIQWLISNLELGQNLQLHLFDVTRDEMFADVVATQGDLSQSGLYRALAERWRNVPGGESWSALVGLYRFGPGDTDVGLLAALGLIAAQAGGPLLAEADPALAGEDAVALAAWRELRRSEAAPWIGLAAPRVLLRQPYGKRNDPITTFAFEEFVGTPAHEEFLWANPGLALALLLGRAFTARGWDFEPGDECEIDDLPAYIFVHDGESELKGCAEKYLGEQVGQALLRAGLIPMLSHRNHNAVTVMRFQSIAEPAAALAGLGRG